ncbi:MAG TPA: HAMP domain-containing sensor histidine kinase [Thermohalobaculum sp.]|nr:HAMP domain-containing sensor histidine kinase [Thermohalobaculum sp.]
MLRRRLYLQIYFTIIASLVIVVVLAALLWRVLINEGLDREALNIGGRLAYLSLPAAEAPAPRQRAALERLADELNLDMSLYAPGGALIAATGRPSPPPPLNSEAKGWQRLRGSGFWALRMPDGRWLAVDLARHRGHRPLLRLALLLGSVALGVGLGAYPLVRRLTRRLERLQEGVERIGAGDLSARVEIQGRDEVARLAASFNEAAEKIENLLGAHRMLLANASHELRTPLSRIRLGAEMLREGGDPDQLPARWQALEQDIAELDQLIDEILLTSRLEAGVTGDLAQPVDLVALAAEECARYPDCSVSGFAPEIEGDPVLLRRLLRNLLENAHLHGAAPVRVELSRDVDGVRLTVSDAGSGIPEAEREKVFRPFYRAGGKQNVKGHGLGLPLVRQIAEIHGGTAEALAPGETGSAIRVTLPGRRSQRREGQA